MCSYFSVDQIEKIEMGGACSTSSMDAVPTCDSLPCCSPELNVLFENVRSTVPHETVLRTVSCGDFCAQLPTLARTRCRYIK